MNANKSFIPKQYVVLSSD